MTERKFLYVQQDTGDKYLLKEADEGDTDSVEAHATSWRDLGAVLCGP